AGGHFVARGCCVGADSGSGPTTASIATRPAGSAAGADRRSRRHARGDSADVRRVRVSAGAGPVAAHRRAVLALSRSLQVAAGYPATVAAGTHTARDGTARSAHADPTR